jgi:NTP pyrophosphatase (non-canonical NTP hydrolase)
MEELGEVAREINSLEGFKPRKDDADKSKLGEELADLIFSIICLANHYRINLSGEFEKSLLKYSERDANRF